MGERKIGEKIFHTSSNQFQRSQQVQNCCIHFLQI